MGRIYKNYNGDALDILNGFRLSTYYAKTVYIDSLRAIQIPHLNANAYKPNDSTLGKIIFRCPIPYTK